MQQQIKLPDGVVLTPSQDKALRQLIDWINDDKSKTWCLYGAPGTGKSFLLKLLIDNVPFSTSLIAVSAPTHKAKKVLRDFTGMTSQTLHSLLGLRPDMNLDNFDINNVVFSDKGAPTIVLYRLLIIDECSMINTDLFEFLQKQTAQHKIKVLYVGDMCQLPPVKEILSPTFKDAEGTSTLMEPVRQSYDNPLTVMLQALRADISVGDTYQQELFQQAIAAHEDLRPLVGQTRNLFKQLIQLKPVWINDGLGYNCINELNEFAEITIKLFNSEDFKANRDFTKYITYTNSNVLAWNQYIRNNVFHFTENLCVGDLLTSYTTLSNNGNCTLMNSEDYYVKSLHDDSVSTCIKVHNKDVHISIPVWLATLIPTSSKASYGDTVAVIKPDGIQSFLDAHNYFLIGGRKFRKWKEYYAFKNQFLLLGNVPSENKKDVPTKDFDYAFAITAHKSQGSTYQEVLVNAVDIRSAANPMYKTEEHDPRKFALQLLYVAISRARRKAHILI